MVGGDIRTLEGSVLEILLVPHSTIPGTFSMLVMLVRLVWGMLGVAWFLSFFFLAKEVSPGDAGREASSDGIKGTKSKEPYWLPC